MSVHGAMLHGWGQQRHCDAASAARTFQARKYIYHVILPECRPSPMTGALAAPLCRGA